jgi:hypothetical protein
MCLFSRWPFCSCSDLGKGSKDLVGEPEVSTCVYDETDRPTIDVVGDNHGVVEAISGFSSKISFQVAAENLSSESELSLAKCAKLGTISFRFHGKYLSEEYHFQNYSSMETSLRFRVIKPTFS